MTIALSGFTRCGKSTMGRALAKRCGWRFLDTDELLRERYAESAGGELTVRDIYRKLGEAAFRKLENGVVSSLKVNQDCVIALGGGVAMNPGNVRHLKSMGPLVYLKLPFDVWVERLEQSAGRPAFLGPRASRASYEAHFAARKDIYESSADVVLEADKMNREEILRRLEGLGQRHGQ